ncbi:two-component regulator propeller domain-containing protein [Collimonas sp.]|uniref:two-component regulator propeller domain-containing protein n=1 Tax=Collimonas sp. TaxID=1963772 RepID=UPI00326513AB
MPFLAADAAGRIFSRQDEGILRWNGKRWESFGESSGLIVGGGINSILFDRDGGVWLGSTGHGLIHWIGYPNWENWTSRQGLPGNVVLSFLRDRQNLLHVGTRSGSATLQTNGYFPVTPIIFSSTSYQWGNTVEDAQGNIWAGSLSGLLVRRRRGRQDSSAAIDQQLVFRPVGATLDCYRDRHLQHQAAAIQSGSCKNNGVSFH